MTDTPPAVGNGTEDVPRIRWSGLPNAPVALLILPWPEGPGCTIIKRDRDGALYGCRDMTDGPRTAALVAAWIADAKRAGLAVEDRREK